MSWDSYEDAAKKGPFSIIMKVFLLILGVGILIGGTTFVLGFFQEGAQVAREEFGPRALLKKYEWFKDAAAECDKKRADVKVFEVNLVVMKEDYEGTKRRDWDRTDKEQFNQWRMEIAGVKASYNSLAAEYNSAMSKFNWRFCNKGTLPQGATDPLPREFKEYSVR